jgi:hypothetical protein
MKKSSKEKSISLEPSYGHLQETPCHDVLQMVKGWVVGLIKDRWETTI